MPIRLGGASPLGVFAGIGAAGLCLAASTKTNGVTFTPKYAVVLLFAAVGIVPIVRLLRGKAPLRWVVAAAVAFLAVGLLSTLVSTSPNIGFFGLYLWGTGWLLWLGAVAAFAIGASLSVNDRRWLFGGLIVGALGNAAVAVWQVVVNPPTPGLGLYDGTQADGLLGNPIHLEALMLGGLALILGRTCRSPLRWAPAVLLLTIGLEFTAERLGLPILALLVCYAIFAYGVRRGATFGALVLAGFGIGYLGGGSGLGSRVTSGTGETTFGFRIRVWVQGAHYVLHHPLLGAGPGQLRTALDSIATLPYAQHVEPTRALTDGHDIFVEVAVTTGLLGLACFLTWLVGAARIAQRGAFFGFAFAMFAVELVEPLNIAILPLAFLSLGAAVAAGRSSQPGKGGGQAATNAAPSNRQTGWLGTLVTAVAVLVALALGITMVAGDTLMLSATHYKVGTPFNVATAKQANTLLPYWPDSALTVASIEAFDAISRGPLRTSVLADSRHWTAVALGRDTGDPELWTMLGNADLELKRYALAQRDFQGALARDRWFTQALQGLGNVAAARHDWPSAVHWYRLAVETAVEDVPIMSTLESLLKAARLHIASHSG